MSRFRNVVVVVVVAGSKTRDQNKRITFVSEKTLDILALPPTKFLVTKFTIHPSFWNIYAVAIRYT